MYKYLSGEVGRRWVVHPHWPDRILTLCVTHASDTKLLHYICGCLKKKNVGLNFHLLGQHASKLIHFYCLLGKMPGLCKCKKELLIEKER